MHGVSLTLASADADLLKLLDAPCSSPAMATGAFRKLGAPPKMLAHDGWSFANYEPNSRSAFKPGVSATRPGAILRLCVDTSRVRRPILTLQHLTSFEHMGRVRAACAGCACTPQVIDAHTAMRVSTTAVRSLRVTPHLECELLLTVLNATSSGEHKWKLERLVLESDLGDA